LIIVPNSIENEEKMKDILNGSSSSFRSIRLYDRNVFVVEGAAPEVPANMGYVLRGGLSSREFKKNNTRVKVGNVEIGGSSLVIAAGPCAVESRDQLITIAQEVRRRGANMLRGGAFKPRTSPYSFQGLGFQGLKYLKEASDITGMPVVSEILDPADYTGFADTVDMLQIGSRNSQNFALLKFAGSQEKPVLLKNGMGNSLGEWLGSAEYILSGGNQNVVLCYRGIRSFETATRFTMDSGTIVSAGIVSHLPVCADPSHPAGRRDLVEPLALAAVAAGATMLEVEVHNDPDHALSDAEQQITLEQFDRLAKNVRSLHELINSRVPATF